MSRLPHDLDKYFTRTASTFEVSLEKLIPCRARTDGIEDARAHMQMAYEGKKERRSPLAVTPRDDGAYDITDGNSTFAVAQADGWPTILVDPE